MWGGVVEVGLDLVALSGLGWVGLGWAGLEWVRLGLGQCGVVEVCVHVCVCVYSLRIQ